MGDILSQNEIDDLLKALSTGELSAQEMQTTNLEKKVRNHDFKKPSKFSKDHIKTLRIINENYARSITNFLTGYLRTLVQVDVMEVEQVSYHEFSNSIPNPVVLSIVDFPPLNGSIIFEMAPHIAFALVDRILGGKGTGVEKVREFSEIELAIIERIITQILNLMREPWENVVSIRPRLERIETNPQFAQLINPNEMIALVTLGARVGDVDGLINICIPYMVIEPIVSKLSTRFWFSNVEMEPEKATQDFLKSRIESIKVPLRAVLGKTTITVNDFLELQLGDVLPLDSGVDGDLDILVGDLMKFYAKPGVRKNKVSIRITDVVRKEEE